MTMSYKRISQRHPIQKFNKEFKLNSEIVRNPFQYSGGPDGEKKTKCCS